MHEFSLADSLVEQIGEIAAEHGMDRIDTIALEVGELRQVVPEVMQLAFREVARGSAADGAALILSVVEARARCRRCDRTFRPAVADYSCPACRVADVSVLAGDDLILASISAEEPAEVA